MPFKMNSLGIAIEDSPQLEALREALVNSLLCKGLHNSAYVNQNIM